MLTRTLTIAVGLPITLLCVYFGSAPFLLLILFLAIAAVNEFYNMMLKKGFFPAYYVGNVITIFFVVFAYYSLKRSWEPAQSAILTLAAAASCTGLPPWGWTTNGPPLCFFSFQSVLVWRPLRFFFRTSGFRSSS